MKNLLTLTGVLFLMYTNYAQGSWEYYGDTYIKGSISGTISQGFIFKTNTKEYFVVNERIRQRVRTRNPDVKILRSGSDYTLIIEDFEEPVVCKKVTNVIETQIDGEFEGWEGDTIFKMINGQIWQQSNYQYMYHYAYSPEVFIYEYRGSWILKVEDVDETIEVIQIK